MGARRGQLLRQLLLKSALVNFVALGLALLAANSLMPAFGRWGLLLFAIPNARERRNDFAVGIPKGASLILRHDAEAEIRGRDMVSGLPRTVVVSSAEVRQALEEPLHAIVDAVRSTLDQTPPELAGDIMDRGIVLTGGGALLRGLDERLRHETGMPVHVAEEPLTSVALGAGKCVEEFEALQQVLVSDLRRG